MWSKISLYACLHFAAGVLGHGVKPNLSATVTNVPLPAKDLHSTVEFRSGQTALDGMKVFPSNDTTVDWWYFDVVSWDHKSEIVITFYTAGAAFNQSGTPNMVLITYTFENGTDLNIHLQAEDVRIGTIGNGSSGEYQGVGDWLGSSDMSQYVVRLDSPSNGIFGEIILKSVAPPHLPCTDNLSAGGDLLLAPGVGWVNVMPDADATVYFNWSGTVVEFSGTGYHDKNWGNVPMGSTFRSWYWGHGRAGPYSVVWFDFLAVDGTEYKSSYVARDGKILNAACEGIKVRPFGANSIYPPTATTGSPSGFNIELLVGHESTQAKATVTHEFLNVPGAIQRWIGSFEILGFEGTALFEQLVDSH
ncbi:hypothetical protein Trihar35433_8293 [Trichoderma harzianum]|nr:hypothetical protein Trihar35433_8293 [Trichoderma harzianum]